MEHSRRQSREMTADLVLAGLVAIVAVVLLYGAASLPPPRFDPLGSAALPRALAVLMLIFSAIIAGRAVLHQKSSDDEDAAMPDEDVTSAASPLRGLLILVALVVYVGALDFAHVPFVPATTAMMTVSGLVLHRADLRTGLLFGAIGLGLALALGYVFTHFLYVDFG
ncbi:tripartite tricarboxylate transporter TctB family protein [Chelativorans sp. M5D2P16]|uniref:tripartite tricarboxylate transporter TctB family protein n=1 Tax=Chelativorans sp. M5D2P16 TaxID=3095678 RepID=UPI002ACAF850|nr:tripartite tricarboxylate transporter TctB family protein [Chelativorans sp. M5D2P16]MDZ5699680.1 tripartite tricarboxylate transporter TctB family protein [Chelativorans sp. M5D2P16]